MKTEGRTAVTASPRVVDPTESGIFHQLECDVQRHLLGCEGLHFGKLTIRRLPNGICLEGIVERFDREIDVETLVREVAHCEEVVNFLVVKDVEPNVVPPKG